MEPVKQGDGTLVVINNPAGGIPLEDGYRLYELTEIMNTGMLGDPHAMEAAVEMFAYSTELVARKRADPGDDIATSLLHAEVDGQRLTDVEFNSFFMLLINAGGDTTRNLVAGGISVLMDHPEERAKLEADPSLLPTAVEEMLRYVSPVIAFVRTATTDTELRGVAREEGRPGGDVLPVGQPGRGPLRRSRPLRPEP